MRIKTLSLFALVAVFASQLALPLYLIGDISEQKRLGLRLKFPLASASNHRDNRLSFSFVFPSVKYETKLPEVEKALEEYKKAGKTRGDKAFVSEKILCGLGADPNGFATITALGKSAGHAEFKKEVYCSCYSPKSNELTFDSPSERLYAAQKTLKKFAPYIEKCNKGDGQNCYAVLILTKRGALIVDDVVLHGNSVKNADLNCGAKAPSTAPR